MDMFGYKQKDTYKDKLLGQLRSFVQNDMFVDVILKVENKKYSCHKNILSASSVYFERMFSSGFKERSCSEIELLGISSIGFNEVYNYIYSGEIKITDNNLVDVYNVSDMLLFEDVKEKVITYFYKHLDYTTCVKYWLFAYQKNIPELMTVCKSTIINRFEEVYSHNDDILNLPYHMFLEIIKADDLADDLACQKEINVLNQVKLWIENHPEISDIEKNALLQEIKWGLIHLCDYQGIQCMSLLESHWKSIVDIHTKASCNEKMLLEMKHSDYFKMRGCKTKGKVVGIHTEQNEQVWIFLGHLSVRETQVWYAAVVHVGNHIVVMGGRNILSSEFGSQPNTDAFDMKNMSWKSLAPMNKPRYQHVAVAYNTYILVIGGRGLNGNILDSVERYDIKKNKWKIMKPFCKCIRVRGCTYKNDVYICGGFVNFDDGNNYVPNNGIYKYNHKNDEWIKLCTIPENELGVCAVCVHKDKIYMIREEKQSFLTFDPVTSKLKIEKFDNKINTFRPDELVLPYMFTEIEAENKQCNVQ